MKKIAAKCIVLSLTVFGVLSLKNVLIQDSFSNGKLDSQFPLKDLKLLLSKSVPMFLELPKKVTLDNDQYKVNYAINPLLEEFVKKQISQYRPDYASVVVIDNDNGNLLTAIDYSRRSNTFGRHLTFSSSHPAASVIKIVTAAELIKEHKVNRGSVFSFNGRSTTLYKYQIAKMPRQRWIRHQTFEEAFAKSNNVIFGKAGVSYIEAGSLLETAGNFGFNGNIFSEINLVNSTMRMPASNDYSMAELTSGFNTDTMMSPIHGAVIASIVANDGVFKTPNLVTYVTKDSNDEMVWAPKAEAKQVLESRVTNELQNMMEMTVHKGTARNAFRRATGFPFNGLDIGGKTGSITGGLPFGKRDWFVSYAKPKDASLGKGVSICVMIVNQKKWYVKSTQVAKNVIGHYYKNLSPLKKLAKYTRN
ncbi:MAG: penicillin-binding transpeptidase domain-containing protein [Bacteriovoracaceae bacterium]